MISGDLLSYKGYYGNVKYSKVDQILHGKVIGIKSSITYEGINISELYEDFKNGIDHYLEVCEKCGDIPEKSYKGSFNVRIDPQLHCLASNIASKNGISLNTFVENAIRNSINI